MAAVQTTSEILRTAADRVQFEGWTRFQYAEDADGRMVAATSPAAVKWCARGAVKSVARNDYRSLIATEAVELHLYRVGFPHGLMTWNDAPARTAGEVADMLRTVAKGLENSAPL